jgi:hypothetical protein
MTASPAEVLDTHRTLYRGLRYPAASLVTSFQEYFELLMEYAGQVSETRLTEIWYMMFAPAKTGAEFLENVARPLYGAPTYQVTGGMVGAVSALYEGTAAKITHIKESDLPSRSGFVWLDECAVLTDVGGAELKNRAFSWGVSTLSVPVRDAPSPLAPVRYETWPGVRITSWCLSTDKDSVFDEERIGPISLAGLPLLLSHSVFVPFGTRMLGRDKTKDELEPDDVTCWVHCLWLFMGTEIVSTSRPPIERHFRKRGMREIKQDQVRVVMLRRTHAEDSEPSGRTVTVDWSCRWVVQGHDRHLDDYRAEFGHHESKPYMDGETRRCRVCGSRLTYIRPYIKGPDGLPLRATDTLYKVAR